MKKDFDCVKMKDEIQQKLLSQWKGLSDAEIKQRIRQDLATSESPIAVWWRGLDKQRAGASPETTVSG